MSGSWLPILDRWSVWLSPFALTFFLVLASATPLRLPGGAVVAPSFALIAVFFWTLHRPDAMPPLAVFAIGLVQDVLSGEPLGVNAAVLVMVQAGLASQRRFFNGKSFSVVWLGFAIAAVGAYAASWALVSIWHGSVVDVRVAALRGLATIGWCPILCRLLLSLGPLSRGRAVVGR